jgi:hypothetical protein
MPQPTTKQMSIDNAQKHHDLASRNDAENTPPDDPSRRISRSWSRKISFPSSMNNFLKKMTLIGKTWTANLFIFVVIAMFTVELDIYEKNEDFIPRNQVNRVGVEARTQRNMETLTCNSA